MVVPRTADDVVADRRDRRRGARADRAAGRGHQPLGPDRRPGDRHRLLEVSEPDRHRRSRRDDGPGRAGRGARPAQCAPQAAGPDVRARRLDQRSGHDRRDDRQQLGRGPLAAVRQDGRPRPGRRGRPGRRHGGDARARSPPTSSMRLCARPDRVGQVHRVVRDTVAAHEQAIRGQVPADPPPGQRLQPRRVRAGPAGPAGRLARRALAVQPGQVDRRLGGDAGGRRGGRARRSSRSRRRRGSSSSRSPRSRRRSIGWPRSSRPARSPSRCSTG